jgi:hypothetical protein
MFDGDIEGEILLQKDQAIQGRSFKPVILEPSTGLLWREDRQCERVQELDEGSKSIQ